MVARRRRDAYKFFPRQQNGDARVSRGCVWWSRLMSDEIFFFHGVRIKFLRRKHLACLRLPMFSKKSHKVEIADVLSITTAPHVAIIAMQVVAILDLLNRPGFRGDLAREDWKMHTDAFPSLRALASNWKTLQIRIVPKASLDPSLESVKNLDVAASQLYAVDGSVNNGEATFSIVSASNDKIPTQDVPLSGNWDDARREQLMKHVHAVRGGFDVDAVYSEPTIQSAEAWPIAILSLVDANAVVLSDHQPTHLTMASFPNMPMRKKLRCNDRQCFNIICNRSVANQDGNPDGKLRIEKAKSHSDGLSRKHFLHSMADFVAGDDNQAVQLSIGQSLIAAGEFEFAPTIKGRLVTCDIVKAIKMRALKMHLRNARRSRDPKAAPESSSTLMVSTVSLFTLKLAIDVLPVFQFQLLFAVVSNTLNHGANAVRCDPRAKHGCACGELDHTVHWIADCCTNEPLRNLLIERMFQKLRRLATCKDRKRPMSAARAKVVADQLKLELARADSRQRCFALCAFANGIVLKWAKMFKIKLNLMIRTIVVDVGCFLLSLHNAAKAWRAVPHSPFLR